MPLEGGSRWGSLVFEAINGKQLPFFKNPLDQNLFAKYKSGSRDNHPLYYCPQCKEKIRNFPLCNKNLILVTYSSKRLSLYRNFSCLFLLNLKSTLPINLIFIKSQLSKRKSPFLFSLMSCVQWKPIPVDNPRATIL